MARTLTDALYDRLITAFPPDRPRTDFEAPMPRLVAHFLHMRLQHRLDREIEALRAARSEWFDYRHPDVQAAGRAFRTALEQHTQFPQDAWADELRTVVDQVTDYLIHPVRTIVRSSYGEEDGVRPVSKILRRMDLFAVYPYLRETVRAYVQQRGLDEIERTRLAALLTRVDRQMTADYGADDWLRLLDPLFTLADAAFEDGGLPAHALGAVFDAKQAEAPRRHLGSARGNNGTARIDRARLHHLLSTDPAGAPAEVAPTPEHEESTTVPSPAAEADESALPRWKQFQSGAAPTPPGPVPSSDTSPGRPLWQRFHAEETPDGAPPANASASEADLDAIERAVLGERGAKNRALFIRHLFGGSRPAYEAVLRRLHAAPRWRDASQIIARDVFREHHVNIYSDPAVSFTDAVEARFR